MRPHTLTGVAPYSAVRVQLYVGTRRECEDTRANMRRNGYRNLEITEGQES